MLQVLLDSKASTTFHDLHGRTVLEIAVLKQYNDIIELLHPGYQQQQEEELMAAHQEKSSQVVYDYITLCKNNLPSDNIESTGFYTNVIQMLSACELLDFSSDIIEKQMSLFEFLNIDCDKLRQNSIHLDYQRNDILKNLKQFHLHKWKLSRSMVTRSNNIKLDELIHYIYLVCEQMYVNYSALHYIENHNIQIKTLLDNYNSKDHVKTLLRLSDILNKYERFVEGTILKKSCLHPAGLIEQTDNNSKPVLYYILPSIGLAVSLVYCLIR
uniref:Uncharacterized protein n=1 Tax=Cacopsylla melanoneura TaxID=428564 RepID=A0A8D8Q170_9HEMI